MEIIAAGLCTRFRPERIGLGTTDALRQLLLDMQADNAPPQLFRRLIEPWAGSIPSFRNLSAARLLPVRSQIS